MVLKVFDLFSDVKDYIDENDQLRRGQGKSVAARFGQERADAGSGEDYCVPGSGSVRGPP